MMTRFASFQRGTALALLSLLLFLSLAWFGTLDYRKLVRPDEGRYAEIPREMAVSGDWVTPRLNDLKYFEKPALQYWATAAAYDLFGQHEWTVRLWPALTGFLGILLAAFTGRRLYGEREGWLAATVLGSSMLYVSIGHIATLDMGLTFFMEGALCGFLLANRPDISSKYAVRWMMFTWAMLALATLSKGIVAPVLAGGTLVFYSLLSWDFSPWRRLYLVRGLLLFLAICAPWFVLVSQRNPEFFQFFFIHEHFERFLTKSHRRYQPWWFFVPILLLGTLPWTTVLPQVLLGAWKRKSSGFQPGRFLLVWSVLIYVFFSVSDSKLPSYILPIFPALALLAGAHLARIPAQSLVKHIGFVLLLAGLALAAAPFLPKAASPEHTLAMMEGYSRWLLVAFGLWFLGTLAALLFARRNHTDTALIFTAIAAFIATQGILLGHENLAPSNSAASLAAQLKPQLQPDVPFYSVGTYEQTLPFYLQRTVTLVKFGDEMSFGIEQEPHKAIATLDEFKQRWHEHAQAFALIAPEIYQDLQQQGFPMEIAAQDLRRIVVRKPQ